MANVRSFIMSMALIGAIIIALLSGPYIDYNTKCFFYSISLTLKSILVMVLPLIIIIFIAHSLIKIGRGAYLLVLMILPLIIVSNLSSTWLAFISGRFWLNISCFNCSLSNTSQLASLTPMWHWVFPQLISNDWAMILGITIGFVGCFIQDKWVYSLSSQLIKIVNTFLNRMLVPMMPLFIFGFALNLQESDALSLALVNYHKVLIGFITLCFSYIVLLYGISSNLKIATWIKSVQNMIPALLAGFSTMSSAAALPLTLIGTHKNVKKSDIVDAVVPLTVNIHLIGDCFAIPIFALAVMMSFNYGMPDWAAFTQFSIYFVMAKFAVAAIPGGGILVMLPILENYLKFSPEMLSIMMALYLLFDPIITGANILGNGAFALLSDKILFKIRFLPTTY